MLLNRNIRSGAIGCALAFAACAHTQPEIVREPQPEPPRPEVVIEPAGAAPVHVRVELARNASERRRGLMFRRELDADAGMLFLYPDQARRSFWMRNTWIPLDIVFISSDRRIVGVVERAEPLTDDARAVEGDSQYVLEVRAGFASAHGLGPGTPVQFVNVPEE